MDIKRIVLWREREFEKINEQKRGTEEKRTKYFTVLYQLRFISQKFTAKGSLKEQENVMEKKQIFNQYRDKVNYRSH